MSVDGFLSAGVGQFSRGAINYVRLCVAGTQLLWILAYGWPSRENDRLAIGA